MAVAAVIVTYNSADVIDSCLESLSKMAPEMTPIVVDNASSDQTVERVRARGGVRVIANAENTQRVDVDKLYVSRITVDEGVTLKRFLPRAHGRATPLLKRTSHITIVVDERSKGA